MPANHKRRCSVTSNCRQSTASRGLEEFCSYHSVFLAFVIIRKQVPRARNDRERLPRRVRRSSRCRRRPQSIGERQYREYSGTVRNSVHLAPPFYRRVLDAADTRSLPGMCIRVICGHIWLYIVIIMLNYDLVIFGAKDLWQRLINLKVQNVRQHLIGASIMADRDHVTAPPFANDMTLPVTNDRGNVCVALLTSFYGSFGIRLNV